MVAPALVAHDRAVNRGTAVSVAGHALLLALAVFAATDLGRDDPGSTAFWLLAAFTVVNLVATLLAWASARAGKAVWDAGVVVVLLALGVMVWAVTVEGGAAVALIGALLLFLDWLVFGAALRVLRTP